MIKSVLIAALAAFVLCGPVSALDTKKKAHASQTKKAKAETGASCKAPAVGTCAACSITCRPGETATCAPGQVAGDMCSTQPACRCSTR